MVTSSSIAMLLACVPLFDALRSSGPRRPALFLVAAVALFALLYLASVAEYWLGNSNVASTGLGQPSFYFRPDLLVTEVGYLLSGRTLGVPEWVALFAEIIKWCAVLAIAGWTTAAQVAAGRHRRKPTPP